MKKLRAFGIKKIALVISILVVIVLAVSCSFFKITNVSPNEITALTNIKKHKKSFYLNKSGLTYELQIMQVANDTVKGIIRGGMSEPYHYYEGRRFRYKPGLEKDILQEVHISLNDLSGEVSTGEIVIPFNHINEIKVIDKDYGLTVLSYIFTPFGIVGAGIMGMLIILIISVGGSCPYIYSYNGEAFVFEGEAYGGAIFRGLERDDYMPLSNLKAGDGICKILISNELQEHQFTNLAELVVVDHPVGTRVVPDIHGVAHLLKNPVSPTKATSAGGQDLLKTMTAIDDESFIFNEVDEESNFLGLEFNRPAEAKNAKLILYLQNTQWGEYVFGEFGSKFGTQYSKWVERQNELPVAESQSKSSRSDFKIMVSLRTNNGWEVVEQIPPVGPMAGREIVVPIDLEKVSGSKVEIQVKSSFMFWEADFAAMDFSSIIGLASLPIKPACAFGTHHVDALPALESDDDKYLVQTVVGDVVEVQFNVPETQTGMARSYYLHTKGYYNHVREFEGMPEREELEKFKAIGAFDQFSKKCYKEKLSKSRQEAVSLKEVLQ